MKFHFEGVFFRDSQIAMSSESDSDTAKTSFKKVDGILSLSKTIYIAKHNENYLR